MEVKTQMGQLGGGCKNQCHSYKVIIHHHLKGFFPAVAVVVVAALP